MDYPCSQLGMPRLRLILPKSDPKPAGFHDDKGVRWSRVVDSDEVSRQYFVRTSAVWRGHQVEVERVLGDQASIAFYDHGFTLDCRPELSLERDGRWSGAVPVDSLTDVQEEVVEAPR